MGHPELFSEDFDNLLYSENSKFKGPLNLNGWFFFLFSLPDPKVQMSFSHHLPSVVRWPSSFNFSHFDLLLKNHLAKLDQY